jgi:transcriptional regulator with XRE-family HTH domain
MSNKAHRLARIIQDLRGQESQVKFAKRIGVDRSTISVWESARAYPDSENLAKIARLKGWSLEQLQTYLIEGALPSEEPLDQILRKVRTMPSDAVAQIAAVAVDTLASRSVLGSEASVKT